MLVSASKFAEAAKTVRVKLLIDQKIKGLALKKGDTCDLPSDLARHLKNIGRIEYVAAGALGEEADEKPTRANR